MSIYGEYVNEGVIDIIKSVFNFSFLKRKRVVDLDREMIKDAISERNEALDLIVKKNTLEKELKSKGLILAKSDTEIGKKVLSGFRQIVNSENEDGFLMSLLSYHDSNTNTEYFSTATIYDKNNFRIPIMSSVCAYKTKDNISIDLYLYSIWAADSLKNDPDCKYGKITKFATIKLKNPVKESYLESFLEDVKFI